MEPTNQDLLDRIGTLEIKVDSIMTKLEQAAGAWLFVKWMGSIALGVAIFSDAIHNWWSK